MKTIDYYKSKQEETVSILNRLLTFLEKGKKFGIEVDPRVIDKINAGIKKAKESKLSVALIGGFSEGKTSIAAAWSENFDKTSMKISQAESTDEVKIYDCDEGYVLIDTPGLFGFKETEDKEKYKDITKKYVSEADLILYVMSSDNPIKESQKEELIWLFKDLNLLPRTIFVLSRFDEEADIEDELEYNDVLNIKKQSVINRLIDFNIIDDSSNISIVGVAANPYDEGIENWLNNIDEYKKISHIGELQNATTERIKQYGGKNELVLQSQQSIVKDVILGALPVAEQRVNQADSEIKQFKEACINIQTDIIKSKKTINDVRIELRTFIINYFKDLILQVNGTDLDTINDFFERNIGEKGIILETTINNEFERQIGLVNNEISKFEISMNSSLNHYNDMVGNLALQGLRIGGDFLKKGGAKFTNEGVMAVRDVIMPSFKFKPWGAIKLADKLTKGCAIFGAVLGIGLDVWDSYSDMKKHEQLEKTKDEMVKNFNKQREEYIEFFNDDETFIGQFFPDYYNLTNQVSEMEKEVHIREKYRNDFEVWKKTGEIIEADFIEIEID